ncbi:transposase [Bradyrhizobium sp. LVM 105]|uniref:IS110 family transposase n=1 Tax=Bradyrhizobium sp. LVM 105 TaxID=2341115 RepID=UPI001FE19D83|nr:transposase [Bradyrhizobium sp. LVM 105]
MPCIRTVTERRSFPTTASGRRSLIAWLRKHQVGKAVMEASGGYERVWAKALRQTALEVRIVDPKRVRSFAESAGRLAKNDKIDAEMIGSPRHSARRQAKSKIPRMRKSRRW